MIDICDVPRASGGPRRDVQPPVLERGPLSDGPPSQTDSFVSTAISTRSAAVVSVRAEALAANLLLAERLEAFLDPSGDAANIGVIASTLESVLNRPRRGDDLSRQDAARALLIVLKSHGAYVYDHCTRLVDLALALSKELGGDGELEAEIEDGLVFRDVGEIGHLLTRQSPRQRFALQAYLAGVDLAQHSLLHDLGKIGVPAEILYKPAPLTAEERAVMRQHPLWGARILEAIPALHHAIPATLHHHERWDGDGYPHGLRGEEIPRAARIVSVVDAFDAMVSDRPYRAALPLDEARDAIARGAGTQFDPDIADAFVRIAGRVWSPDRQY